MASPLSVVCNFAARDFFVGETLAATIVVRNDAAFVVDKIRISVDLINSNKRSRAVHRVDFEKLFPGSQEIKISTPLTEEGDHTLAAHVLFTAMGKPGHFNIDPIFSVRRLLSVDQNVVRAVPSVGSVAERVGLVACVALDNAVCQTATQYIASFALSAKTSSSMRISSLEFEPAQDTKLRLVESPQLSSIRIRDSSKELPPNAPVPVYPSEVIRVVVRLEGPPRLPANTEIGLVRWKWIRGATDTLGSDFHPLRVPPAVGAGAEGYLVTIPTVYPPQPTVGEPFHVTLSIRKDDPFGTQMNVSTPVSLAVHLTKLLPSFLYTGPILIPLGVIKPTDEIRKTIVLIPNTSGILNFSGAFDLRDTAVPHSILWPLFPMVMGGGVPARGAVQVTGVPPEYPPRLLDVMVYPSADDSDTEL